MIEKKSLIRALQISILVFYHLQKVSGQCWINSYGRGVGTVVSSCDANEDKDGALCYPKCKSGYKGIGPICFEKCRSGYTDYGFMCIRGLHIYSKSCCCVKIFGFKKCCNKCKDGYKDDGCSCRRKSDSYLKKSYERGVGSPLKCPSDKENDASLCYKKCKEGYNGVGPVCWFKGCNGVYSKSCGLLCTQSASECAQVNADIALSVGSSALSIMEIVGTLGASPGAWIGAGSDIIGLASSLINDKCTNPSKLATKCWKSISSSGTFNKCTSPNNADCGIFCASSIFCEKNG